MSNILSMILLENQSITASVCVVRANAVKASGHIKGPYPWKTDQSEHRYDTSASVASGTTLGQPHPVPSAPGQPIYHNEQGITEQKVSPSGQLMPGEVYVSSIHNPDTRTEMYPSQQGLHNAINGAPAYPFQGKPVWHLDDADGTVKMTVGDDGLSAIFTAMKITPAMPRIPAHGFVQAGKARTEFTVVVRPMNSMTMPYNYAAAEPLPEPTDIIMTVGSPRLSH